MEIYILGSVLVAGHSYSTYGGLRSTNMGIIPHICLGNDRLGSSFGIGNYRYFTCGYCFKIIFLLKFLVFIIDWIYPPRSSSTRMPTNAEKHHDKNSGDEMVRKFCDLICFIKLRLFDIFLIHAKGWSKTKHIIGKKLMQKVAKSSFQCKKKKLVANPN